MDENNKNNSQNEAENQQEISECDKIKKERDEYLDGWQRARAELINHKKDESKRFEMIRNFANESIIRDIIGVLDNFELAVLAFESQARKDAECSGITQNDAKNRSSENLKGVYLIKSQIEDILKNYGLERLAVSAGQNFDPSIHEAVAVIESDKPSNTVIEEVERGYLLNGKLIRPARVKVAK